MEGRKEWRVGRLKGGQWEGRREDVFRRTKFL